MIRPIVFLFVFFLGSHPLFAQDTTSFRQTIQAFSESFSTKDYQKVAKYLHPEFKLGEYSLEMAEDLFSQIYAQYPTIKQVAFLHSSAQEDYYLVEVIYRSDEIEDQTSQIELSEDGKIIAIHLFDELMRQSEEQEAASDQPYIDEKLFLSKKQRKQFYQQFTTEIERFDAEGQAVRNASRSVKWDAYKKKKKKAFLKANSWEAFGKAYQHFARGFINLHAHFDFNLPSETARLTSNIKLGFTYPEVAFFVKESGETVTHINGVPIHSIFEKFEAWDCAFSGRNGALSSFVRNFSGGKIEVKGAQPSILTLESGAKQKVIYSTKEEIVDLYARYTQGVEPDYPSDWKLISKGYKVALLQKGNKALIKIKNFIYLKGNGGDLRCSEEANDSTMCSDIRLLRTGLSALKDEIDVLIFDVQNNGGGNENSFFIAEFAQNAFYDLLVQYRKTKVMENDQIRNGLFYGVQASQKWYDHIQNNGDWDKTKYGDFLPSKGDFCQGDSMCLSKPIQPNSTAKRGVEVYILTNGDCVSSCDDFVWRMQQFGGAKIVGQPQAADATYARISVVQYLDKEGNLQIAYSAQGGQRVQVDGTVIAISTIPYSRTVDKNGNLKQGVPAKLDLLVPITKSNYSEIEHAVLKECEALLE